MKKDQKNRKITKSSFGKDYLAILKDLPAGTQWKSQGDAFTRFSLYKDQPTIAKPYTTYQG